MSLCRSLLLAIALPLAFAAPRRAAAQQDSTRADSLRRTMLDPVTVTASRVPAARSKIGSAVSIVTAEQLKREPPATAAEAVGRATGAFIERAAGPGGPAIVRLRGGEEVFSLILMDGVQINQTGGFFDFQGLGLTNVERIEVSRGPQSALYGSTAVNGVVHFITRPGRAGPARLRAELAGGDASAFGGAAQGMVAVGGGRDALRYSAALGAAYDRGVYALPHDVATREASLRLDGAPRPGIALELISRFIGVDGKLPVRDPGATRVPLDPNAENARDRFMTLARATARRGAVAHRFSAALYRDEFVYRDLRDGVSDSAFFVFDNNIHFRERARRTTLEYQASLAAHDRPASLVLGGQWERESMVQHIVFEGSPGSLRLARPAVAAFAEARGSFGGRLHALLGARVEKVRGLSAELTPRATAVFAVSDAVSLRAAAGRAYKAPNLQTQYPNNPFIVGNPDLRAETSWSFEVGSRVRLTRVVMLEAAWFRQRYANLIRTVQFDSSRQINRNIGRSRASGVELEASAVFGTRSLEVSAVYLRTEVLDTTSLNPNEYPLGGELPYRPGVTGTAALFTPLGRRLELAVRSTVVGRQVVLSERFSGRRVTLDAYTLLAATLTLHVARDAAAFLRLDNLLDARYETGFDRHGIPRTAMVGMRWGT